jgi:hypothetical protein
MTTQERVEALREELEDDERELRAAVAELEIAARQTLQPREWVRRRPLSALGGAFLVGWWMGRR